MSDLGLSQYDAGEFLVIYSAMIVFGWLMTVIVPMILRPVGEPGVPQTAGQYAALASGKERYAEAVMARLAPDGRAASWPARPKVQYRHRRSQRSK